MLNQLQSPLPPGSVIGILGGGQLGRMTALAAARLGYRCHVFSPEDDAPAAQVSWRTTVADWRDEQALAQFAGDCDVVTYEFENIPTVAAASVARHVPLRPAADVLATCQDRITEKRFLGGIGVPTAPWRPAWNVADLRAAVGEIGCPAVLKSARLGYDGKGQVAIDPVSDLDAAWTEMTTAGEASGVLEAWVEFALEISVLVARSIGGELATYVPVENRHENHVLRRTVAPAPVVPVVASEADAIARRIAEYLDLVGVLAVEMFVTADGGVLVNELAPRPHNSGHWTIDGCAVSQFEQCVRAIAGLPLGSTERHANAVMDNLLGAEIERWYELASDPSARLHLYGKRGAPRPQDGPCNAPFRSQLTIGRAGISHSLRRSHLRCCLAHVDVSRCRFRIDNHDIRHHSLVFVLNDVAVVDELSHDHRIGKRNDDLNDARLDVARRRGQRDHVVVTVEGLRLPVHLRHLEIELVDVEYVRLLRGVLNRPLLDIAELHHRVYTVRAIGLAIDIKQLWVRGVGEDDGPTLIDLRLAQVRQLGEGRWRRDRDGMGDRRSLGDDGHEQLAGVLVSRRAGAEIGVLKLIGAARRSVHEHLEACARWQQQRLCLDRAVLQIAVRRDDMEALIA